jgi:peptidyl-prolyl cis-trans isomerase C
MRISVFALFLSIGTVLSAQAPVPQPKPATPALPAPAAAAPAPDKVILAVGDEKMTVAQWEEFVAALPAQARAALQGPGKRQMIDQLVGIKVLAQEARKRKIDQKPGVKAQLALNSDSLLAGTLFTELQANAKVGEADGKKYYDEHKSEYERVKARHILIRFKGSPVPVGDKKDLTEEESLEKAKALRARIVGGEDFAAVAKAESDDKGSGVNGGDLDFFGRGQMTPPFDQAAFSLPEGKISDPVRSQFGYHLIEVQKHETKPFEDVRAEIEKKLGPELAQKAVENLKSQTPVQVDEAFFGPAEKK